MKWSKARGKSQIAFPAAAVLEAWFGLNATVEPPADLRSTFWSSARSPFHGAGIPFYESLIAEKTLADCFGCSMVRSSSGFPERETPVARSDSRWQVIGTGASHLLLLD